MADTHALGACALWRGGSSPLLGTNKNLKQQFIAINKHYLCNIQYRTYYLYIDHPHFPTSYPQIIKITRIP